MPRASTNDRHSAALATLLLVVLVLATLCTPQLVRSQSSGIAIDEVAAQLGVGLAGDHSGQLFVGVSFTGVATDPAKLEALGIHGAHRGARVTVMRIAEDKLLVEVDEMSPAPLRVSVRLKMAADGTLSRA